MSLRLGLDTGGTCTDAALLDGSGRVVASAKARTVHASPLDGLRPAALAVLAAAGPDAAPRVTLVSLSTTLATNAVVEGRGRPAGLVLIGAGPRTLERPDLRAALAGAPVGLVAGGHAADGAELAPLDADAVAHLARRHADEVEAWAVSAAFSVRNPAHEREAARLLAELTGLPVSLGHALSSELDAPRRALTALLNARLLPPVHRLLDDALALLGELGIDAPLCVVRGDGTLVSAAVARAEPVQTVASGPAASVVGARHLAGLDDCTVIDLGGTTTDVARIVAGAARDAPGGANVGGMRTRIASLELASSSPGADAEVRPGDPSAGAAPIRLLPRRVEPLAALAVRHPGILGALEAQLARAVGHDRDARFVMRAEANVEPPRSGALAELLRAIDALAGAAGPGAPVALGAIDAAGAGGPALDRRLERLEASGHVTRAGFTPTDAAHVLGRQATGVARAAALGASLLARRLGGAPAEFAALAVEAVARGVASAAVRAVIEPEPGSSAATSHRLAWIDQLLFARADGTDSEADAAFRIELRLTSPIVGVGAPAHVYLPRAADLLGTRLVLPPHAEVANAVGAVAGVVRRERRVTIQPTGRHAVRVLLPGGPREAVSLEAGAALAADAGHGARPRRRSGRRRDRPDRDGGARRHRRDDGRRAHPGGVARHGRGHRPPPRARRPGIGRGDVRAGGGESR